MFNVLSLLFGLGLFLLCQALVLRNGGYEDLHIVIQNTQLENDVLVQKIKKIFTEASRLLFVASRNQVFFRKVKIIVPKSWAPKPEYKQIPSLALKSGYVMVGPGGTETPHVTGLTTCGKEGTYMYLSPKFILTEGFTNWGNHAKVIVHEWGHLRWGIYDEYAYVNRDQPAFYLKPDGWKPVSCTEKVKGKAYISGLNPATYCNTSNPRANMDPRCMFEADTEQSVDASLMGHAYIKKLTMFCDQGAGVPESQRHNREASNNQNNLCDYQSAWDIMRKHKDFSESNRALPISTNTDPEFELQQETDSIRIFVFDVSGSMQGEKLEILQQTARFVIKNLLPLNSSLGIVTFESSARSVKPVTEIKSQADRDSLIAALPSSASGGTCIGCGVTEAIKMLTSKLGSPEYGKIILVSDGETSAADKLVAIQAARSAKVTVHTVVVTQNADPILEEIASQTGGVHVAYLEIGSISFASAFTETISEGLTSVSSQSLTLVSEKLDIPAAEDIIRFQFTIDKSAGKDTEITIMTRKQQSMSILLTGPDDFSQNFSTFSNTATMQLPEIIKAGDYQVQVVGQFKQQTLEYIVRCYPSDNVPIQVATKLSSANVSLAGGEIPAVYALLSKGFLPIFNASVQAKIEAQHNNCTMDLQDNGQDPDTVMNDGTYSGYVLPECLGEGRVAVKVYARGDAGTSRVSNNIPGAPSPNETYFETELESFQRVRIAENFFVSDYVDQGTADKVPPGRITDLKIYHITTRSTPYGESRKFTITWTATGDDKSVGQAAAYEMKISSSLDILLKDFSMAVNLDLSNVTFLPQPSGETEALLINIEADKLYTESAFFAVRAFDKAGNVGPVSNIVEVVVAEGYRATGSRGSTNIEEENDAKSDEMRNNSHFIIIIAAVSGGVGVFASIVIVMCIVFVVRRRKK